jgi:hypothetical protein
MVVHRSRLLCGLLFLALLVVSVSAQAAMVTRRLKTGLQPSSPGDDLPQAWAAPVEDPPTLDGRLDDKCWSATRPVVLGKLERYGEASPRTEARFLHKAGVLYVGLKLAEPNVGKLKRSVKQHDGPAWEDDSVELFLQPRADREYYQLVISAGGAVFDRRGHGEAADWDSKAKTAVAVDKDGWSLEAAIPMAALGADDKTPGRWRVNVYRNRQAGPKAENQAWSPTLRGDYDVPERFGHLLFTAEPPWGKQPQAVAAGNEITVEDLGDGKAVLKFDLSAVPKGAKVYRASLLCQRRPLSPSDPQALADIEVYPLAALYQEGTAPKTDAKPLVLLAPEYRSFDVLDLVRAWAEGRRPNHGLYVKTFPGWMKDKTYLDLAFEGKAEDLPPQPTGLKTSHRAGQTFITWREAEPLIKSEQATWGEIRQAAASPTACRYRVYSHSKPIDAKNISEAQLLATVEPLSAYNTNGRNLEYLIGQAMIQSDEMGELARDYNGYIYTWGMDHPRMDRYPVSRLVIDEKAGPLPAGSGLYVHHPASAGNRYYAVASIRQGVENAADFSPSNALLQPVAETVGSGEPVRQGKGLWGPYFDWPGTRWVYVQWCAPPLAPQPNMYFNYSVLVPPDIKGKAPAELYFHPAGYSYAQPGKKLLADSIQIAPHDYPPSGWYGFNEAYGAVRSPRAAVVRNHTQRRIIAFLEWAKKTLPVDEGRIVAAGADGAASLALNFPDMFAFVWITGFDQDGGVLNPKRAREFTACWGPASPDVKDDQGRANWAWAELDKLVLARKSDLPLFACSGASWGRLPGYAKGQGRFYSAMLEARQPLHAGWGWEGGRSLGSLDWYTGQWRGMVLRRDTPVLAFSNCTADHDRESSGLAGGGFVWKDLRDAPDEFSATLFCPAKGSFDLTPRRLVKFKVRPNERLRYEAVSLPGPPPRGETIAPQSGEVAADAQGLVVVKGLNYGERIGGLVVKITRTK